MTEKNAFAKPATSYRWVICGLLFFATTINYLDRAVISFLKSTFAVEMHWTDADYANVEIAFKIAYAIGLTGAGRLIDRLGTRTGYALATGLWSAAAIAHAFVNTITGFAFARTALGLTEAGNFPAAIRTVAEWFPQKERALATGIFNSGANVGAILAPLTVPFINAAWGWQATFVCTGSFGLIWLFFWFRFYQPPALHPRVSPSERAYIADNTLPAVAEDQTKSRPTLRQLLRYPQTWAFIAGKFLTDPIWWFYLFWLPDFLEGQYGLKGTELALPIAVIYTISVAGSIGGGWLPYYLIKRGAPAFSARKKSLLVFALCVLPVLLTQAAGYLNMWAAIGLIGLAASAHQAWSANLFTTVSDLFPKNATATVTGIGGMFGALGGILLSAFVQKTLFVHYRALHQIETAYLIMFVICSTAYLLAWLVLHFLVPMRRQHA